MLGQVTDRIKWHGGQVTDKWPSDQVAKWPGGRENA